MKRDLRLALNLDFFLNDFVFFSNECKNDFEGGKYHRKTKRGNDCLNEQLDFKIVLKLW